ncbi:MAG: helix-turn-helix transcriptional regulator [Panacagrimonas sp.]
MVGERLRALRLQAGLTQEQLADAAGMDRLEITRIERGPLKASLAATRRKLAVGFGVTLDLMDAYLEGLADVSDVIGAADPPTAAAS